MAGYVASARLQGGVPRFVGGGAAAAWFADGQGMAGEPAAESAGPVVDHVGSVAENVDLVGRPIDDVIADWLASVGESWSQLTFFLFDPDSWR